MKKKILAPLTLAALMVASVAGATPMTDFHAGVGQVDLGMTQNKTKYDSYSFGNKWNFNGGVTYGIAEKLGLQYDYHKLKAGSERVMDKDTGDIYDASASGNEHELNLLYTLDPNVAAFVGWNRINGSLDLSSNESGSTTNNVAQLGLVAKTEIAKNLDLYGKAAIGTKSTFLGDAGLGYKFANDWDFNLGYRYLKTKLDDINSKFKGMYAGVTYRFGAPKKVREDYVAPTTSAVTTPSVTAPVATAAQNDYYFNSIHFDFDKDNIKADQVGNANSVVNAAKQTGHVFKLVGNTDGLGSNAYNDDLSKRRVDRVAEYIKAHGVPASQIVTMYKGKNNPTDTNNTDAGRAANRRVDVYEHK